MSWQIIIFWARINILILLRKHCTFLGTIKPRQTAYHTDPVPMTQAWHSSNKGGEVDVEQNEEGKDVVMTRVETWGAAQLETM